jgi:hypothetical protein
LARFEFKSGIVSFYFSFIFISFGESRLLVSCCVQLADVTWRAAMRTMARLGDLVQRTGDSRTGQVLGGRAIEMSGVPCAVCTVHVEMRSAGFLVEP